MTFLKERKTPSQNLAFLGILAAVCVVLCLVASFVPFVTIFAIFILSALTALGTRLCQPRYAIPFLIGTIALMLATTFFNLLETLFYLAPAVLCGGLYGFLAKLKAPSSYVILAISFLTLGLNYAALPLIRILYEIDVIETTISILGWQDLTNVRDAFPALLFALGLAQGTLTHFIIVLFHGRLEVEENSLSPLLDASGAFSFATITMAAGIWVVPLGYLTLVCSMYFAVLTIYAIIVSKSKFLWISGGIILVGGVFFVALLTPYFLTGGIVLIAFYPFAFGLLLILFYVKKNVIGAK